MPKCPKCNAEIYHLNLFERGVMEYRFDGTTYEGRDFIPDPDGCTAEYECPECCELVASTEEGAKAILEAV